MFAAKQESHASRPGAEKAMAEFRHSPDFLFWRLHKHAKSIFSDELAQADADITTAQYSAMLMIDCMPGIDQVTLATEIAYDRATIGGIIDRLEQKGLVRRMPHPEDRRIRTLYLGPEGERLLSVMRDAAAKAQARMLASLSVPQREMLLDLIQATVGSVREA